MYINVFYDTFSAAAQSLSLVVENKRSRLSVVLDKLVQILYSNKKRFSEARKLLPVMERSDKGFKLFSIHCVQF